MFEAILRRARRQGADICRYFKTCRRRHGQNRSNPASRLIGGTPKWLRSWVRAALRVAMLPAAATRTRYLRHFDASLAQLMGPDPSRSEEHTSELQSLMRISYAVFCLKKKNIKQPRQNT